MLVNAIDGFSEPLADLKAALDASGVVGTWDWDCVRRTARYDAGAAALLAGDPALAGQDLHGPAATAGIHPDDVGAMNVVTTRAIEFGSLILAEYRAVSPAHGTRWLLSRGRVYRDEHGRPVRCKGILIDITEGRHDARDDSRPYLARPQPLQEDPLDRAAGCCLEARDLLAAQEGGGHLRLLLDMALYEIGLRLARRAGR